MSGKKRRPTKRRRQSLSGPRDLKQRFLEIGDLDYDHTNSQTRVGSENGTPLHSRHSGVYGDTSRSVTGHETLGRRSSRRFLAARPSQNHQALASSGSSIRSKCSKSVASFTMGNSYRATVSRSRRGCTSSIRSAATKGVSTPKSSIHVVCAVGENLACETCIASIDAGTPISLQVTKQCNGQTYAETTAYLEMLKPDEVLLNEGRKNSPLARKIVELYEGKNQSSEEQIVVKFISRGCFDQTKGADLLRKLARTDTFDPSLVEEYILLSSSHAVLHYVQQSLGASFSRKCLDVVVNSGGRNRMSIDRSTLLQLELLTNAKTGKTRNSLVSSIDCTKTTVGTRLLRTTLMAPPCRSDTINSRLELVDSFLADEDFFYATMEHLQNLPAVDKMLTNIAVVPRLELRKAQSTGDSLTVTPRLASKGISALVCVKSTLSALPALGVILQDHLDDLEADSVRDHIEEATAFTGRSSLLVGLGGGQASKAPLVHNHLLRAIVQTLKQPQLAEIREEVSNVFTESTNYSRNPARMRHQECFALKSQDNGMMEILRKAFLANVDDIYKKADEYAEIHGMYISVRYTSSRGYYLSVPGDQATSLPNIFIQPIKSGNQIHCTTEEVYSLNNRAQDNVQDLLLMTYERIQEVLEIARSKYDALAALSDAIALLDLCHGFADKVSLSREAWVRPIFKNAGSDSDEKSGDILIRNGRYAIDVTDSYLSSSEGPTTIIPNDTYASARKPFTVISGINGSGKSTYLKQIAIIVLLAHCGSYVPAEQALIPLRNRLCARMGASDDQENNISSFMLEMKETAFICCNASEDSLILLDELGRATSNEDGMAIAWSVSEFLLKRRSITFFVTHYPQLCQLSKLYPSVQNQHMDASVSNQPSGEIRYTHKLTQGACDATTDYGIEMATSCGWTADVVESARAIERSLREKISDDNGRPYIVFQERGVISWLAYLSFLRKLSSKMADVVRDESSVASLRSKLQRLYNAASQNPKVPLEEIRDYLRALRRDLDVNPSCWKSTGLKNLKQYTDDESHSLDAYRKPAADATFPRHNRVSAPAESSGDDSSLTSQSNSFGPKE